MAETRDLLFRFLGDTKNLDKATGRADKSLGNVDKSGRRTTKALGGMTKAIGALGLAIGAREVLRFANDAAKMSDAAEIAAVSLEKVLGPAAQTFRDNLEDMRHELGLNTLEVDQLGAQFGLLLTGMGASQEATAELSSELILIGGNLAAFRGDLGEAPQAIEALGGAMRGEFDALEKFGVKLNEAGVKAEVARLEGMDPLFAALGEGEKRLIAINSLITTAAAPAMGALEDAMDSTAAKSNELNTEIEDMQIELGGVVNEIKGVLIPALTFLLRGFIDVNKGIGRFIGGNAARLVFVWIPAVKAGFADVAATATRAFATVRRAIDTIVSPFTRATGSVNRLIARLRAIRIPNIRIPGFATGGVVGGPRGAPQMAVVHGGERITTGNGTQRGDGGGGPSTVINVTVNAGIGNPQETARAIVDVLQVYNRTNGRIPIQTGGT